MVKEGIINTEEAVRLRSLVFNKRHGEAFFSLYFGYTILSLLSSIHCLQYGSASKGIYHNTGGNNGRPIDFYFITVSGGFRPLKQSRPIFSNRFCPSVNEESLLLPW